MHRLVVLIPLVLAACSKQSAPSASPENDEVKRLVINDLGSPAFGGQKVEVRCVSVSPMVTAGGSVVVAARVQADCVDKTFANLLWIYVRAGSAGWNEQFMGPGPTCWKGVPPDLADAIAKASGIPKC